MNNKVCSIEEEKYSINEKTQLKLSSNIVNNNKDILIKKIKK